jgi:hypothetical protein
MATRPGATARRVDRIRIFEPMRQIWAMHAGMPDPCDSTGDVGSGCGRSLDASPRFSVGYQRLPAQLHRLRSCLSHGRHSSHGTG